MIPMQLLTWMKQILISMMHGKHNETQYSYHGSEIQTTESKLWSVRGHEPSLYVELLQSKGQLLFLQSLLQEQSYHRS
jgi:hypothetical protein